MESDSLRRLFVLCMIGLAACRPPEEAEPQEAVETLDEEMLVMAQELAAVGAGATLGDGPEVIYILLKQGSLAVADQILGDVWDLGKRFRPVHISPITWQEDPYDSYWRFLFYGLRPANNLIWAYYVTGDTRYRDKFISILRSYTAYDAQRPTRYQRATFDNRHTAAFRAMVLVNAYVKLRNSRDLPRDLEEPLRRSIEKLGYFLAVENNFEPEHNHGLTEAAALTLVAVNFPEFSQAASWRALGIERLRIVLHSAVDDDGVATENSPFYHFYILTFAYQINEWAKAHGIALPEEFGRRTVNMIRYGTFITQPNGLVPLLGASLKLQVRRLEPAVYSVIGQEYPEFEYIRTGGTAGVAPRSRNVLFPEAGQSILRSGFGTATDFRYQTHLTFNVGPWRSDHSHADVLGITMYGAGKTLLPDSGLYIYDYPENTAEENRYYDYFFGTRAHNTVVVDGQDQSAGRQVQRGLTAVGDKWAYQSGAHALYTGVRHRRSVLLLEQDLVVIVDHLASDEAHDYAQTWHLYPGAQLARRGLEVEATDGTRAWLAIRQALPANLSLVANIGDTSPIQGWYSENYRVKSRNYALEYHARSTSQWFVTLLAAGRLSRVSPSIRAVVDGNRRAQATVCAGTVRYAVDIVNPVGDGERVTVTTAPPEACR